MKFTAKIIADFTKGEIIGNPDVAITGVSRIEEGKNGTLAFLANPKYEKFIYTTEASVVLINKDFEINGNLDDIIAEIKGKGIVIELDKSIRTGTFGKMTSVYLRDPDGNLIELSQYLNR